MTATNARRKYWSRSPNRKRSTMDLSAARYFVSTRKARQDVASEGILEPRNTAVHAAARTKQHHAPQCKPRNRGAPLFQIVGQRAETRISPNRAPSELLSVCSENRRKKLESAAREQERRYGKAHARAHPRSGL